MTLRRIFVGTFTHQVEPSRWRFLWLAMPLYLIATQVQLQVQYRSVEHSANFHPSYSGLVVAIMLLLNILASMFRWSPRGTVVVRVAAWAWMVFGVVYVYVLA